MAAIDRLLHRKVLMCVRTAEAAAQSLRVEDKEVGQPCPASAAPVQQQVGCSSDQGLMAPLADVCGVQGAPVDCVVCLDAAPAVLLIPVRCIAGAHVYLANAAAE